MSDKDDHDWFELVAGREVPDASAEVVREAAIVHASLLRQAAVEAEALDDGPAVAELRAVRLQARVRREGLLPGNQSVVSWSSGSQVMRNPIPRLFGWRPASALALAVALAVGVTMLVPPRPTGDDSQTTQRGALPRLVVKEVPDPAAASAALGKALREAGLEARVYSEGNQWYVEATMPDKPGPALVDALSGAEVYEKPSGPLRVIFTKSK